MQKQLTKYKTYILKQRPGKILSLIQVLLIILMPACLAMLTSPVNSQKIPIDTARWYQVNHTEGNLSKLFDNNINTVAFTGWSKIFSVQI